MVWKSRERGAPGSVFGSIFMESSSIPHGFFIPGGLGHFAVWGIGGLLPLEDRGSTTVVE
jgi:hypothetical protein